ncbi:MAG: hypothetical protein ACX931_04455 [Saccharospirillum sp.]
MGNQNTQPQAPTFLEQSYGFWALVAAVDVIIFLFLVMPWGGGRLEAMSGGIGFFDALLSYSPERFYQMAAEYTEAGRRFYVVFSLIADSLFPLTYGLFFYFLLIWLAHLAWPANRRNKPIGWLPLATVVTDFLENALLIHLIVRYPSEHPGLVQIASTMTSLKWLLVAAICVLSVVLAGFALWRWLSPSVKP